MVRTRGVGRPRPLFAGARLRRPLLAALQLGCIRVGRGAGSEDPADNDADDENGGNEDEVASSHPKAYFLKFPSSCRSSPSTRPSRRQIDQR
jgi:hypothetical protein